MLKIKTALPGRLHVDLSSAVLWQHRAVPAAPMNGIPLSRFLANLAILVRGWFWKSVRCPGKMIDNGFFVHLCKCRLTLPILDSLQQMTKILCWLVDIPIDTKRLVSISLYPSMINLELALPWLIKLNQCNNNMEILADDANFQWVHGGVLESSVNVANSMP